MIKGLHPVRDGLTAVFFDFDGTIADTMPAYTAVAVQLLRASYAAPAGWARRTYLETSGVPFRQQLFELYPKQGTLNSKVADRFESRKRQILRRTKLIPPVMTTLRELCALDIRVGVCSSTRTTALHQVLTRHGWGHLPHSGIELGTKDRQISKWMTQWRLDAAAVLFVGDSLRDAAFADRAGVRFLQFVHAGRRPR